MGTGIMRVKHLAGTGRRRAALFGTTGVAVAAAVGLLASPAGASAAGAGHPAGVWGTEHVQLMTTSATATTDSAIAWGVFTAGGVDKTGNSVDTLVFPGGTIKVAHSQGTGPQNFNPQTCLMTVRQHGTYSFVSGTGRFKGISGHGRYALSIIAVAARTKSGACSQTAPPVAWQQVIDASGPVRLP